MTQRYEVDVHFLCPSCGKRAEDTVVVPEPNFGAENARDSTSEGEVEVECDKCDELFEGYAYSSYGSCSITLTDHEDINVSTGMPSYSAEEDDWLADLFQDNPALNFREAHDQMMEFLADHGEPAGASIINRMIFTQLVAALEAYLGDTILETAVRRPTSLNGLIASDRDLNSLRFSLTEIVGNPNIPRDIAISHLKRVLWHDLRRADFLYKEVFGVRILADPGLNALLLKAVQHRHDCVHRNGKTAEGDRLDVFTPEYVRTVAGAMTTLVERLEREILANEIEQLEVSPVP